MGTNQDLNNRINAITDTLDQLYDEVEDLKNEIGDDAEEDEYKILLMEIIVSHKYKLKEFINNYLTTADAKKELEYIIRSLEYDLK